MYLRVDLLAQCMSFLHVNNEIKKEILIIIISSVRVALPSLFFYANSL